jgi:hypothetical protein
MSISMCKVARQSPCGPPPLHALCYISRMHKNYIGRYMSESVLFDYYSYLSVFQINVLYFRYEKWYLYYHFVTTFSLILTLYFYSLSLPFSLSPLFLTNEKREKEGCQISCTKWLFKYHCSFDIYSTPYFISIYHLYHVINLLHLE